MMQSMSARANNETRDHLLAIGEEIILGKGFSAVGLAEILAAAKVPKGSFYHYFASKEGYGVAMLERYFEAYLARLDALIADHTLNGRAKLDRLFESWCTPDAAAASGETHCLVSKLSGEVSDLSESMRLTLDRGMADVVERLAACIVLGRADRSIASGQPAEVLAAVIYAQWLGVALQTKVRRNLSAQNAALAAADFLLS
ncbi:MAG: TetR/AcrR family transcriptional regulator [Burkholderiales bacterium]|nr:TetR/AcrR family transcriptional regulator [Burkholderiales bacterium]